MRLLAALIFALYSAPVLACSACFDPKAQSQGAFRWGTVFLSLTPILAIGGAAAYVWWKWRAAARAQLAR